jgi:mRNA interferase MazF
MNEALYWPDAGDLVWTDFDPTLGREQAGRRPALVVSPSEFTRNTGFVIVCPITSKVSPFPTSVALPAHSPIKGEILLSDIRSLEMRARTIRFAGDRIPDSVARAVREKLEALITV